MRVQAAILVDDDDRRNPTGDTRRPCQQRVDRAVAVRGRDFDGFGRDPRVVCRYLDLRLGVIRAQRLEDPDGGHATDGVLGRAIEEATSVDQAMDVAVEQLPDFRIEIFRIQFTHVCMPSRTSWLSVRSIARILGRGYHAGIYSHKMALA